MDRVKELTALLGLLDRALAGAEPRELAGLSREKRLVLAELDSLAGLSKGSTVDQLAQRRADRRAKAKVASPAAGEGVKRRKRSG